MQPPSTLVVLSRHLIAMCGAWFAANNIAGDSTASILVGLGIIAISTLWSWISKGNQLEALLPGGLGKSEMLRTLLGSLVSQGITALSTYFAIDANHPELLLAALANAGASKAGLHQKMAFIGAQDALKLLLISLLPCGLMSCAFMASAAGMALIENVALPLAGVGLKAALDHGKVSQGDVVTVQRGLAIVTNPNDSTVMKVFELAELGIDKAVKKKVIKDGDSILIKDTEAIIQKAVVPAQPGAKQPVKVVPVKTVSARSGREYPRFFRSDVPGCMQVADRVVLPLYGERVAIMLANGEVRN